MGREAGCSEVRLPKVQAVKDAEAITTQFQMR